MQTNTEQPYDSFCISEAAVQNFVHMLKENERSDATIEKYSAALRRLMNYLNGATITKQALLEYRDELKKSHAAQSVNGAISAINSYLILNNRADLKLKLLKVQRSVFLPQEKELTQAEYNRLIAAAKQQRRGRLALLIETIGGTGIRVGEVQYITAEAAKQGKAEIFLKGKIRTIPLARKLCRKLLQYAKENGILSGPIFLTKNMTPISRKQIWAEMKAICDKAQVKVSKVFPHNLRHLFARCYYKVTRDIVDLADMLGHSSIETTRIYLKTSLDEHEKTLMKLGLVS